MGALNSSSCSGTLSFRLISGGSVLPKQHRKPRPGRVLFLGGMVLEVTGGRGRGRGGAGQGKGGGGGGGGQTRLLSRRHHLEERRKRKKVVRKMVQSPQGPTQQYIDT